MTDMLEGFHVAIVGAGPAGYFTAEGLLKDNSIARVDVIDRLPTPFGLVRYGVAPDHQKMKSITRVFERISAAPGFRFIGGVHVGQDISLEELRELYDAVVLAVGCFGPKKMGVPGEELDGVYSAAEFVGWYNGLPEYAELPVNISTENAVVFGHGNVAADVARLLLKPKDEILRTDAALHAVTELVRSQVKRVYLVGRGGPERFRINATTFLEIMNIEGSRTTVPVGTRGCADRLQSADPKYQDIMAVLDDIEESEFEGIESFAAAGRHLHVMFGTIPVALQGNGRVENVVLSGANGQFHEVPCGLVVSCTGFTRPTLPGLTAPDVIPNADGRVLLGGRPVPGLYVTGWARRGPSGSIGTNRSDAGSVIKSMMSDFNENAHKRIKKKKVDIQYRLRRRGVRYVDLEGARRIDHSERKVGELNGKPREKIIHLDEMFAVAVSQNLTLEEQ